MTAPLAGWVGRIRRIARGTAPGKRLDRFAFRAASPLFDTDPFHACGRIEGGRATFWAEGSERRLAMTAEAHFS